MVKQLVLLIFCLVVGLGASPAFAQKGGAAGGAQIITIRICNNTNDPANVSISYQPVNQRQFYNQGWFTVQSRACSDLAETTNGYFYAYAEVVNDGTRYWSGDFPLCVVYPGPFNFWSDDSDRCANGQEVRQFVQMQTNDFGVFTWNLDQ